ncbi:Putative anthrone oxygenase [Colletotrichum destructivum]|uniref:Anthrone oxygenase n=1 Tax=Colletotrichum destructivum TaxID=34406 RepID=A0AAX4IML5_9PEZI|nr:Putative anthrone oxygenase [Colletotrichum destructivum]
MSVSAYVAAFGRAPPAACALGAGLVVTSSLLFGNVGLTLTGPLPIIRDQLGTSSLSAKQKVRVWRLFFDEAADTRLGGNQRYVVVGTGLTAALHLGAFALGESPISRRLALMSALCSVIVLPYTAMAIMPTNKALIALDDKVALSEMDRRKSGKLIEKWDRLHKVRFLMYSGAWLCGLAAFTAAL